MCTDTVILHNRDGDLLYITYKRLTHSVPKRRLSKAKSKRYTLPIRD